MILSIKTLYKIYTLKVFSITINGIIIYFKVD